MGDTSRDPVDHSRTTRQHAGETMKNAAANGPGLITIAVGVIAMVVGLASFATGSSAAGGIAIGIAVLLWIIGGAVLFLAHRRVRQKELHFAATNPHAEAHPPTS
ncbi:hypothetical protein [Mycolicibacterium grossiae]|uniref:UsfY protein n=1 Tax=Mycolicibacterium grossiae TaxID=1552759 RepID=A0A1E8QB03_9MYCO|nr:hypothetical protein [Mycolicibacterium grossiae]OFJ55738.1 hypothetical protein BEL07_00615 [Mycolicibacterium grossiae]QEM43422.1 hypothetical protein FZ046_00290 [Mycolicibacterium grossiae]